MLNNENGSLISLLATKSLGGSFGNNDYKKKMKVRECHHCGLNPCMEYNPTSFLTRRILPLENNLMKHMAFATRVHHLTT
jgi:hypothetical protein